MARRTESAPNRALTSTATSRSPSSRRTRFSGSGLTVPPSTSTRPSRCTGLKTEGIEIEALMASYNPPLSSTTSSPVSRSAATAAKGTGIRSICTSGTNSFIASITRSPLTSPSVLNAKSTRLKTLYLSSARIHSLNGSRYPEAYTPPTSAPIEVPATALISNPCLSNSSMAPIWATPRAPPPASTSATLVFFIYSLH